MSCKISVTFCIVRIRKFLCRVRCNSVKWVTPYSFAFMLQNGVPADLPVFFHHSKNFLFGWYKSFSVHQPAQPIQYRYSHRRIGQSNCINPFCCFLLLWLGFYTPNRHFYYYAHFNDERLTTLFLLFVSYFCFILMLQAYMFLHPKWNIRYGTATRRVNRIPSRGQWNKIRFLLPRVRTLGRFFTQQMSSRTFPLV